VAGADGEGVGETVGTGVGDGLGDGVGCGLRNPAWPNRSANTKIRTNAATISATQMRDTRSSTKMGSSGDGRGVGAAGSVIRADYAASDGRTRRSAEPDA